MSSSNQELHEVSSTSTASCSMSACVGGHDETEADGWSCTHCTLRNTNSVRICEACGKTNSDLIANSKKQSAVKVKLDEAAGVYYFGDDDQFAWTCTRCTFINQTFNSPICEICGTRTSESYLLQQFQRSCTILEENVDLFLGLSKGYGSNGSKESIKTIEDEGDKVDEEVENVDKTIENSEDNEISEDLVRKLMTTYKLSREQCLSVAELTQLDCDEELAVGLIKEHDEEQAKLEWKRMSQLFQDPNFIRKYTEAKTLLTSKRNLLVMVNMIELGYEVNDVIVAAESCTTVDGALTLIESKRECPCCMDNCKLSEIITLFCNHEICRDCAVNHFTERIREHPSVLKVVCPVNGCCDEMKSLNYDYYNFLSCQLQPLLDEDVFGLFQRKLRDHTIERDENFLYCTGCSFGFFFEPGMSVVTCPGCRRSMCPKCKADWERSHKCRTCVEVVNIRAAEISNKDSQVFIENTFIQKGIQCPKCQFKFELTRGGCMHFTCTQCKHEFCEGCSQEFYKNECKVFADCKFYNLHAHHPRSCHHYLRDYDVADLERLFQLNSVEIPVSRFSSDQDSCQVLLQRNSNEKEKPCAVQSDEKQQGLCERHYKEHLSSCINKLKLDPIKIFEVAELTAELQRNRKAIPAMLAGETDGAYKQRLTQVVIFEVPYEFKWTSRQ